MYGLNAGYDTRPMATGAADSGVSLFGSEKTVFFQQAAVSLEAVSNTWNFNAYGLIPTGDKEQRINFWYLAGSLATYGIDAGYNITPDLTASIGYYYQDGDGSEADGSGVLGRVTYEITNGLIAGVNLSYDEAFETRFSADVEYRFGGPNKTIDKKVIAELPVIQALSSSPNHRSVRVHDKMPATFKQLSIIRKCLQQQGIDPWQVINDKRLFEYVNYDTGGILGFLKENKTINREYKVWDAWPYENSQPVKGVDLQLDKLSACATSLYNNKKIKINYDYL